MKNIIVTLFSFLLPVTFLIFPGALGKSDFPLDVDTPLKAFVLYFPSPSIMRCLSHSSIPKNLRKALIYRRIIFPDEPVLEHNVLISIDSKSKNKFVFTSTFVSKGEVIPTKIDGGPFFSLKNTKEVKPKSLFGLGDLVGLERRISVNDLLGDQKINFEVFLKGIKGKIGKESYTLELYGSDRGIDGEVRYFLTGTGKLGDKSVSVTGREINKDYYEISELIGEAEVFTLVRVYD